MQKNRELLYMYILYIVPAPSPTAALDVVVMTICGTPGDDKAGSMTTLGFVWRTFQKKKFHASFLMQISGNKTLISMI